MRDFNYYLTSIGEVGYVDRVTQAIVYINGLPGLSAAELVVFETGAFGEVTGLGEHLAEIMLFSGTQMRVGTKVTRTNLTLEVPVGNALLGHTITPLGASFDKSKVLPPLSTTMPVDMAPKGIKERKTIVRPFETGITIVDFLVPLGKGQREVIIGDRKTGKSNFLTQTVITQARQGNICIYAAIGKKKSDVKKLEEYFIQNNVMSQVIIVATSPEYAAGIVYVTPYAAMTIAEYFKDQGKDVVLVLDDLSTHAKFYREIALLGKRFPGRDSYPGDIFHTHAKLLERAGNYIHGDSEASITCIPVVETTQGDLSAYIPTNVMSMTYGHGYVDNNLFVKGRRPAVNPFLSVTRVGRQTQSGLKRDISRELISFLTLYDRMENFAHFGQEASESTKVILETGDRIIAFFDQKYSEVIPVNIQLMLFGMLWNKMWQDKPVDVMKQDMQKIIQLYKTNQGFRSQVDAFILKHESFNSMLGDLRQEAAILFSQLLGK